MDSCPFVVIIMVRVPMVDSRRKPEAEPEGGGVGVADGDEEGFELVLDESGFDEGVPEEEDGGVVEGVLEGLDDEC